MKVLVSLFFVFTFILNSHAADLFKKREDREVYRDPNYGVGEVDYSNTPLAGNNNAITGWRTTVYPVTSRGGTGYTIANDATLRDAVFNPGSEIQAGCVHQVGAGERFESRRGQYNITSNAERARLVQQIKNGNRDHMGTTTMTIGGRTYDVMNDNIKLPDGTYVPLTFPEAQEIAQAWGCEIPSAEQISAIAQHSRNYSGRMDVPSDLESRRRGSTFVAYTREPNNGTASQLRSLNAMMNDSNMLDLSELGRENLIDGHFKWYDNRGRINGFYRGNNRYWQNSPSGAHVGDPEYWDYSHGVRLICPQGTRV